MPRLLILFSLVNLVIGTGAFVVSGILDAISADLGVSVSAAGQAMTAYAVSTAVLAPLAMVLTRRLPRKQALLLALGLFTAGNVVCALAGHLGVLLAGRVLMGMGAVFTPIAAGIAVAGVEPARRGRALSLVFLGISLSYVVGLPLGAWLGLHHGWQLPVAVVAGFGAAGMLAVQFLVDDSPSSDEYIGRSPEGIRAGLGAARRSALVPAHLDSPAGGFAGLAEVLRLRQARGALLLTLLYFAAIFCVFAYAGPVLTALVPMGATQLSVTLMLFGLSGVAGTLLGGWAADHFGAVRSLKLQLATLALMMALVPLTRGHYAALVVVFMVWGTAGFGMMAPQQARLAALSPDHAPLLLSLNSSMLYFGTAAGATVGGAALGHGVPFTHLPWVGIPFAVLGWLALWAGARGPLRLERA
jgi:DHA1 family inner membrane transport protein